MLVLGLETSCDETAAAVLNQDFRILSSVVLSQDDVHAPYGGVVPELASRRHIETISRIVERSLDQAGMKLSDIDALAVTQGPGLIGSLLVGLSFAKGLAFYLDRPLVPVDHLESHIFSVFIENSDIPLPGLALLVSGGHTSLFRLKNRLEYETLARTRDDAAGEALDKIAKSLNIGYPGGPIIDRLAEKGDPRAFKFSLPQMTDGSLDYSFSGLKTAALRRIKEHNLNPDHPRFTDFLASFQQAVVRALLGNLAVTARRLKPKSLILCGGVARNRRLRKDFLALAEKRGLPPFIPSPELCTDNAAMVAALAVEKVRQGKDVASPLDLNAYPRLAF